MSKKIISAILVMAMVISMSATALLSSVGAAAETDYEADRTTLKTLIQNLVIYGPELEDETLTLLEQTKILTWNKDLDCATCGADKYNEYHARHNFWDKYTTEYTVDDYLFKATTDKAAVKATINETIKTAASAWYFGTDANNAIVDATFNAGRNEVVKEAIKAVKGIFDTLKAEVGANDDKPVAYAEYYMGENYKGFATAAKAYNQSIGFNPYLYIISAESDKDYFIDEKYWGGNALGQYPVRWYTFAEAREIDAEGVFNFEIAIREIAMKNGAEVLFSDFIANELNPFLTLVEDLFANLVGEIDQYFVSMNIDDQIKAFLELEIIIDLYDLYIKDVYNNIYTAASAELLNDVLYAKRVIDYINNNDAKSKLLILALTDFEALTSDILSGIAAVAPRSEQILKAADIAEGTALIRKAEALLTNWAHWASNDDYKGIWNALNNAKNDLKNMLPAAEGESVLVVVAADSKKMKNLEDKEVGNDRVVVEFTPNWFSFVKFYALLEAQVKAFSDVITGVNGNLGEINLGKNDNEALVNAINKYAFLAGVVGKIVDLKDGKIVLVSTTDAEGNATEQYIASSIYKTALFEYSKKFVKNDKIIFADYLEFLNKGILAVAGEKDKYTGLYEAVLGNVFGNNEAAGDIFAFEEPIVEDFLNQDAAIDNAIAFISTLVSVIEYALDENNYKNEAGEFDWVNETWSFASSHEKQIAKIESALKALTKDITKEIQTYYFVLAQIMKTFGWELDIVGITEDGATKEIISNLGNLIGQDNYEKILEILDLVANDEYDHPILEELRNNESFGSYVDIIINLANGILNGETAEELCWQEGTNYPNNFMDNARDAANELFSLVTIYMMSSDVKVLVSDALTAFDNEEPTLAEALNRAVPATYTTLKAAFENFIDMVKANLLTDKGAAELDKFVEDVYTVVDGFYGKDSAEWNEYDMLLQKLVKADLILDEYFSDMISCYDYFALTLAHAAECPAEVFFTNKYNAASGALEANYLNKLNELIGKTDVKGYTREWAENFNTVRELAAYVVASIKVSEDAEGVTTAIVNTDMPVWYAERVLNELATAYAEKDNYTTAKLVEYKAGLEALLIEADSLNVYNYVSNTEEAKAIWANFVDAYTNAQYVALDSRCPFADVDAAVEALTAAMAELEKIEAAEGASDADTLAAKIAAAEALYARADVTTADKSDLEVAIAAAKKVLQFNISVLNSTDIDNEVKALDNVMNALLKTMYTGKDLKKDTKVIELQVVVELYTEASYRKFANAVENAYAIAEEDTATESAMKAAYANVEARFADLKLAPVEEEVVEPETSVVMEEAIAIYNEAANGYEKAVEGCTAESAAAYNAAINTLKADIENNADDAKLLESIITLNLAKAALTVEVPETCDC